MKPQSGVVAGVVAVLVIAAHTNMPAVNSNETSGIQRRFGPGVCGPVDPASDDEFVGSFTLPSEPFRVLVTGVDEAELRFHRMSPVLFRAEALEVIPSTNDDEVSAGETAAVTFKVRNFGPADHFRFISTGPRGKIQPVEPAQAQLDRGAEVLVTVRVTVPADAVSGSDASVFLTATGDAPSESMNYATKRLAVRAGKLP